MYLKKFENEDYILYYNPTSDEDIYDIAAVVRERVSPDEAVFLFGYIPRAMMERENLPELLLQACGTSSVRPENTALMAQCKLSAGCQGLYRVCQDTLDGTIRLANQDVAQPDIQYLVGDATYPQGDGQKIIAHVCNDAGAWGSGFVVALSKRWAIPEHRYRIWHDTGKDFGLGGVQFVPVEMDIVIANMIAQHGIRKRGQAVQSIRYKALDQCLCLVAQRAVETGASIHMPRIGCGRAGGSWAEVEPIIRRRLTEVGVPVFVYDLSKSERLN